MNAEKTQAMPASYFASPMPRRAKPGGARAVLGAFAVSLVVMFAPGEAAADDTPIGEPQIDSEIDEGTVVVRIIGEDTSQPIAGVSVDLVGAGDSAITARTGASGFARFPGLSAGDEYIAQAEAEGTSMRSPPLSVPDEGGVRVTMSTEEGEEVGDDTQHRPAGEALVEGPQPGAPARPGAGEQRPDPREMSGVPRGEQNDPGGQLTIRALQGEFSTTESNAPDDAVVHLVSYGVDGSLEHEVVPVPDDGRAVFERLRTDRTRTYYALSVFERETTQDRLRSHPITMPEPIGVRVMLAGPEPDSEEEAVDSLMEQRGDRGPPLPPGEVRAHVMGDAAGVRSIDLVEITGSGQGQTSSVQAPSPLPGEVQGNFLSPNEDDGLAPGTVRVHVTGQGQNLAGIEVDLVAEDEGDEGGVAGSARTGSDGYAQMDDLEPGERYRARATVHGRQFESAPLSLPDDGGVTLTLPANWRVAGALEGRFDDVASGPDKVYAAQVETDAGVFRSMPFQLTSDRGAAVRVVALGDLALRFHLAGQIDDERVWFDAQFAFPNPTSAPLLPDDGEVTVHLPDGFTNATVGENHERLARTSSDGFVLTGPVGPGQEAFRGQFALPTSSGTLEFDMPLPYGAWNSQLILEKVEGMELMLPDVPGMEEDTRTLGTNEFAILSGINIQDNRRLVVGADGLPQRSLFMRYLQWAAGALGIGLLVWGVVGLFSRREDGMASDRKQHLEAQRERLLDELAELEGQYKRGQVGESRYKRSRENLWIELESVYQELGVGSAGSERKTA